MLETLIQDVGDKTDFLSSASQYLIPDFSIPTWLDIIGVGTAFVGGAKKNLNVGLTGLGIAAAPEVFRFVYSVMHSDTPLGEDFKTFFYDGIGDSLFVGASYVGGLALGAFLRARQRQSDDYHPDS